VKSPNLPEAIDTILADDDADAAARFLRDHPGLAGELWERARTRRAPRVLHELDLRLGTPPGRSLDTPKIEVRLQGHSVLLGRDHAYLMVIIDDHPAFEDDPRFENRLPDGRRYATLGAGPRNMVPFFSELVSGVNRKADLCPILIDTFDIEIQHPRVETGEATERAVVDALFAMDAGYGDKIPYDIVPFDWSDGFNSNSFVAGLLEVTGWEVASPGRVPGWEKPLPPDAFGASEALDPEASEGQRPADGSVPAS
jgi:hypothetical protein